MMRPRTHRPRPARCLTQRRPTPKFVWDLLAASAVAPAALGAQPTRPAPPPPPAATVAGDAIPVRDVPLATTDTALTRAQAVARALQVSVTTAIGAANVRNAHSEERVAMGAYLPALTLTPDAARVTSSTAGVGATPPAVVASGIAYTMAAGASVDVFTAGRRGADTRKARADLRAVQAQAVTDRFAVESQVDTAFYAVRRAEELIAVARVSLQRAQQVFRAAERQREVGTATRADVLTARLAVTTAQQALLTAATSRNTAVYTLGQLAGYAGAVGALDSATPRPTPLPLSDSAVVALAVTAAPSVRSAAATAQAAGDAVTAARTQYAPTFTVTAARTWANNVYVTGAPRAGWALHLGASYPLFNGFVREDYVERAVSAEDVARATSSDATRRARAATARLLGELRLGADQVALAGEAVAAAAEAARVQRARYGVGAATILDVTTAEAQLATAQQQLVNARYDYVLTRAALAALLGREL